MAARVGQAVYLIAAVVLLLLSASGRFQSMAGFPFVCGGILALVGLGLLIARRRRSSGRAATWPIVLGLVAAVAAPGGQWLYLLAQASAAERAALAKLESGPAPHLEYDFELNEEAAPGGTLADYTVINFWATWCSPCVKELPLLEEFSRRHDPDIARVIGFTRLYGGAADAAVEQEVDAIAGFLAAHGVSYYNLVETGRAMHDAFAVERMPSTVLLGPQAQVLDFGVGIAGSKRILAEAERLLAGG